MKINLGNFLVKKPLRWMFSQLFGSKIKFWFDDNVSPVIDASLSSGLLDLNNALVQFVEGDFVDKMLSDFINKFKVPKSYEIFAKEYIRQEIKNQIEKSFNK